jgi:sugar lactone lactonase YvrE
MSARAAVLAALALSASAVVGPLAANDRPQAEAPEVVFDLGDAVQALSASADGRRILAAGGSNVRVWDATTHKEIVCFRHRDKATGRDDPTQLGALSPDGRLVAACFGAMKEVFIFDVASGDLLRQLDHGGEAVKSLAFSPDGKSLITSAEKSVRLWDVTEGKERLRPMVPLDKGYYQQVAFSPDGKTIAAVGDAVYLCSAETGAEIRRLPERTESFPGPHGIAFSPDGKLLAVAIGQSPIALIYDPATGELKRRLDWSAPNSSPTPERRQLELSGRGLFGCDGPCAGAPAFTPDGKAMFLPCTKGSRFMEVATGRQRLDWPCRVYQCPRGDTLIYCAPGTVHYCPFWGVDDLTFDRPDRLDFKETDLLWRDLANEDALVGYRAVVALAASPKESAAALAERLTPEKPVSEAEMDKAMADLRDDDYEVRAQAFRRLAAAGELARPRLKRALANQPSADLRRQVEGLVERLDGPPGPEQLRRLRAVEVLEYIGSEEARKALRKLAAGPGGALAAEDARAALRRLERK